MSWSVIIKGEANRVMEMLGSVHAYPVETAPQEQVELAKQVICMEIQAMINAETTAALEAQHPTDAAGNQPLPVGEVFVEVDASGHQYDPGRGLHIKVDRILLVR